LHASHSHFAKFYSKRTSFIYIMLLLFFWYHVSKNSKQVPILFIVIFPIG